MTPTPEPDPLAPPAWVTLASRDGSAKIQFDALRRIETEGGPAPAQFWYYALPGPGRPRFTIWIKVSDQGDALIEEVVFSRPADAASIDGKSLRLPHANDLAQEALEAAAASLALNDPAAAVAEGVPENPAIEVPSPYRRMRYKPTREYLQRVADIYQANADTGAPVLAVSRALKIGQSTAFRHVKWARDEGLLPPR